MAAQSLEKQRITIPDPSLAKFLFGDVRMAWVWLLLRVWLGSQWLESGWGKASNPDWVQTGVTLQKFWERAVIVPEQGRPVVAYDWYRGFLQLLLEGGHYTWFAKLVVFGEIVVGILLIAGAFTGIAAVTGVFMNWHFVMAGAASVNGMYALVGILLVLAWKTAGWWGLDRWILPTVGVPWQTGSLLLGRTRPLDSPNDDRQTNNIEEFSKTRS